MAMPERSGGRSRRLLRRQGRRASAATATSSTTWQSGKAKPADDRRAATLPAEMQAMAEPRREAYVKEKVAERKQDPVADQRARQAAQRVAEEERQGQARLVRRQGRRHAQEAGEVDRSGAVASPSVPARSPAAAPSSSDRIHRHPAAPAATSCPSTPTRADASRASRRCAKGGAPRRCRGSSTGVDVEQDDVVELEPLDLPHVGDVDAGREGEVLPPHAPQLRHLGARQRARTRRRPARRGA